MHRRFPVASFALRSRSPAPIPKEPGWMHQLAAGEPTAWARLMDEWSPRLYYYITANGVSEAEAQALLPPIFSAVVQKVVGAQPMANVTVLLFTSAYQQMVRYCYQQATAQGHPPFTPAMDATIDSQAIHLRNALQQFSPEVQQMALLYYLCDVSVAEISQIVRQPALVVKTALNQVKRQLCR